MEGWVKFHRKSYENFLYKENRPHTKREAWEDIIALVNFEDGECLIGDEKILCKRGQSVKSLDSWARLFNWDKSKVKRFFDLLKKESMIETENLSKTTRITVCKYEDYQGEQNASETHLKRKRNASETHLKPIKEEEEKQEENIYADWKINFETYKKWLRDSYEIIVNDEYIKDREEFYPNVDIEKTITLSCKDYWVLEKAWKKKKSSGAKSIDWKATFNNILKEKRNLVYKPYEKA